MAWTGLSHRTEQRAGASCPRAQREAPTSRRPTKTARLPRKSRLSRPVQLLPAPHKEVGAQGQASLCGGPDGVL